MILNFNFEPVGSRWCGQLTSKQRSPQADGEPGVWRAGTWGPDVLGGLRARRRLGIGDAVGVLAVCPQVPLFFWKGVRGPGHSRDLVSEGLAPRICPSPEGQAWGRSPVSESIQPLPTSYPLLYTGEELRLRRKPSILPRPRAEQLGPGAKVIQLHSTHRAQISLSGLGPPWLGRFWPR